MADNLPEMLKDELTCPICTEIYTDPVQLPCQHSFCRECLKVYVKTDNTDSSHLAVCKVDSSENQSIDLDINAVYCPVCRKSVKLDSEAVSKLPAHFIIANIVGKYHTEVKKVSPQCSMCDGDNPKTAVKACVTCKYVYCQDCLVVMHPMRGPFAKHSLIPAENYSTTPECDEHNEPLKGYCCDCKMLCCFSCALEKHSEHDLKKPAAAFVGEKDRLAVKIKDLKTFQDGLRHCIVELSKTDEHIATCFDDQTETIEKRYRDTLKSLDNWRSVCLEGSSEKRRDLFHQTNVELERLKVEINQLNSCLNSATDLADQTSEIQYLLVSQSMIAEVEKLCKSSDCVIDNTKKSNTAIEDLIKNCENYDELFYLVNKTEGESVVFTIIQHNQSSVQDSL